ncbi:MAG: DedA family protein [Pirellulaceae bacterium]
MAVVTTPMEDRVVAHMENFILSHGSYAAIILILALTGIGLPLPEEVPIVAAGVLSSSAAGRLNPWLAFLSCLLGACIGDSLMYGIGRYLGHAYLRKHPWFARLLHEEREQRMEQLINQHGLKILLLARFLVGVRSPTYLAAGVMRTPYRKFLLADAFCSLVVVGISFWLSHFFGGWIGPRFRESQILITAIVVLIVVFAAVYFVVWKMYRRQLSLDEAAAVTEPRASAENVPAETVKPTTSAGTGGQAEPAEMRPHDDVPRMRRLETSPSANPTELVPGKLIRP